MAMANTDKNLATSLRIATFNVSMEALNYVDYQSNETPMASGEELKKALSTNHLQIRNIAEIIQKVNPDIILLNEFDHLNGVLYISRLAHKNAYGYSEEIEKFWKKNHND